MKALIDPIDIAVIESELSMDRFVRKTNNGDNEVYILNHFNSPNVMREIGRLRELTFRAAGGGTGNEVDIDLYDTRENAPYQQLIVWNPINKDIVGGYRFVRCSDVGTDDGIPRLATTRLFKFSEQFRSDYLPFTIELGRSFVQPKYQPSSTNRMGLFSLDNLWDGLGAIVVDNPDIQHFYGKVTMYLDFNVQARDMILAFMSHYFPDHGQLVQSLEPLHLKADVSDFLKSLDNCNYKEGHKVLNQHVRSLGENIPPLINAYMNLSATMKTFGTALNDHFGEVEETGILVTINDIYNSKKERHINTYVK